MQTLIIKNVKQLFQLLLEAELIGVSALLLTAVHRARVKAGIALAAHLLNAVVLTGQLLKGRLDLATAKSENEVEGGFLLDVVISQSAAIFKLLAGED